MTTIETSSRSAATHVASSGFNFNVLWAVFKRNLLSYFSSPTGYVFICLFVFMTSVAAFLPAAFFNANLANLDQLNIYIPFIMLFFVPAITMSIWADEARQGTDELLLTMPAADFDIVVGKYLAGMAIFTVSLLFSMACNCGNLLLLGNPDPGLFILTYFGYWLLGSAMLAIGMVASFLTRNLTVAYILGAAFNAPLALLSLADVIPAFGKHRGAQIRQWSFGGMFDEFGRGIFNLSGLAYFITLAAVMLYLSMIFIGRRHWMRAGEWVVQGFHYFVRTVCMLVIGGSVVYFLHNHDVRVDATQAQLSSLSPNTVDVLNDLRGKFKKADAAHKRTVRIEAFISPEVPDSYVQTRLNLLSVLRELESRGGDMLEVEINPTERYGQEADLARKRYGIEPKEVNDTSQGVFRRDNIYMAVAFTSGLEKVVLPFIDRGVPVEYELVRSLCTVTEQKRKRVGVVESDAPVFGRFSMQGQSSPWRLIDELKKQYEVVQVNPTQPIPLHKAAKNPDDKDEGFDVLLAIQPSAMGRPEMEHLIEAIKAGQPTVIFEDPLPFFVDVPGTSAPRRPQENPMMGMMQQQHSEKGNIKALWKLLGVTFSGASGNDEFSPMAFDDEGMGKERIIWEDYNPYPRYAELLLPEFIFVDSNCGAAEAFCENDPISSKLQQLFFAGSGYLETLNFCELKNRKFVPLVNAGTTQGGTEDASNVFTQSMFGKMINPYRSEKYRREDDKKALTIAAHIQGDYTPPANPAPGSDGKKPDAAPQTTKVNVVLCADVDMLSDQIFMIREQGENGLDAPFKFDNVPFVLNALDSLAGEERFLELRKRRPAHRTLARFEERTQEAEKKFIEEREKSRKERDDEIKKVQADFDETFAKIREDLKASKVAPQEAEQRLEIAMKNGQRELDEKKKDKDMKLRAAVRKIEDERDERIHTMQRQFITQAIIFPPIPPLVLAGLVFFIRRSKETEGVSKKRLV
jgi:ABC-2 type transport system permease protein